MKKFLIFLFLWAGVLDLTAKPEIKGEVQIKGRITPAILSKIDFIIKDSPLDNFPEFHTVTPDTNGNFSLKIPAQHFSEGVLVLGRYRCKITLMPGDRLYLTINGTKLDYQGKGSEKNNLLYLLKNAGLSNLQAPSESSDLYTFADSLEKQKAKRLDFLKNFPQSKTIEAEFKQWFRMDTQVQYEQIMLGRIKPSDTVVPPVFRKIQNPRNLLNDRKLCSANYINLVNKQYLAGQDFQQALAKYKKEGKSPSEATYAAKNELLEKLPPLTQEYMLAYLIQYDLTMQQKYDTFRIQWFQSIAKNNIPLQTVNSAIEKLKFKENLIGKELHPEFSQTLLTDSEGHLLTFGEMMKQHQGKVVYLDIWSLSCFPCCGAMPGSKLLRKKLAGLPVVFIYLVPDNSLSQWKNIVNLTGTSENHYQLSKGLNSRLLRAMTLFWVPVYMIFDKQGHLVSYRAPSPSDVKENETNDLEEQLRRLAEE